MLKISTFPMRIRNVHRDYEIEINPIDPFKSEQIIHNFTPLEINPFKKVKLLHKKQYLRWLREINLNPVPANISISSSINRLFNNQRFRTVYMEG